MATTISVGDIGVEWTTIGLVAWRKTRWRAVVAAALRAWRAGWALGAVLASTASLACVSGWAGWAGRAVGTWFASWASIACRTGWAVLAGRAGWACWESAGRLQNTIVAGWSARALLACWSCRAGRACWAIATLVTIAAVRSRWTWWSVRSLGSCRSWWSRTLSALALWWEAWRWLVAGGGIVSVGAWRTWLAIGTWLAVGAWIAGRSGRALLARAALADLTGSTEERRNAFRCVIAAWFAGVALEHLSPHVTRARLAEVDLALDRCLERLHVLEDHRERREACRDRDRAEDDGDERHRAQR
jgi:hypothetical protein